MTAGTSSNSLPCTVPYQGPDRLTTLPAEILQSVASNMGRKSLLRLRLANRSACAKTNHNFLHTFLHTVIISTTKSGIKRGLRGLQIENPNTATKVVKFTQPYSLNDDDDVAVFGSGSKSRPYYTQSDTPSKGDIKALVKHMPNVNTIVMRDDTLESEVPQFLCRSLTAAPHIQLTDLTIHGAKLSGKVLIGLLSAHKKTLRSVVLRNIHATDGPFVKEMIETLSSVFGLTTLVIERIGEDPDSLTPFTCSLSGLGDDDASGVENSGSCPHCDESQYFTLFYECYVLWSMHGHLAVEMGLQHILGQISKSRFSGSGSFWSKVAVCCLFNIIAFAENYTACF
jgi:hypothetical protein